MSGACGCATVTNYQAIDQALVARATRQAVSAMPLPKLDGKAVFVRAGGFSGYPGDPRELTAGYLRWRLTEAGIRVSDREGADAILDVLGEIQGIHGEETRFVMWPFGPLSRERTARVKVTTYLYDLKTGKGSGPYTGTGVMSLGGAVDRVAPSPRPSAGDSQPAE